MTVKRILFIRPGETDWNRSGKQQGVVAAPLNALGVRQAEKLADFLPVIGAGALYVSTTRRAAQTGEIIARRLGTEMHIDDRLRERDVGHWQGLTLRLLVADTEFEMADLTNTSVTTIARDDDGAPWHVVAVDDVLHLDGMETQSVIEPEDRS